MTKEEIYKYINYQGKYDINVKRRLKKLIKKYHPDLNNGDDKVMKLINEVRKEIENNEGNYKEYTSFKKVKSRFSKQEILNITVLINKLKIEIKDLNKKIKDCYHDEYELYQKYNSSLSIYNQILLKRDLITDRINKIKKINRWDKISLIIIIVLVLFCLFDFNYFIWLLFYVYIIIIVIAIRIHKVRSLKKELISIDSALEQYKLDIDLIKLKINDLKLDIFKVKKNVRNLYSSLRTYEKRLDSDHIEKNKESYKKR